MGKRANNWAGPGERTRATRPNNIETSVRMLSRCELLQAGYRRWLDVRDRYGGTAILAMFELHDELWVHVPSIQHWRIHEGNTCRFYEGDPPNGRFCSEPAVPGKPYCHRHLLQVKRLKPL